MAYRQVLIAGFLSLFALAGTPVAAQDQPRFALVTSFPTPTVSFQWEVSNRFALRVEGSYSFRNESLETSSGDAELLPTPGAIRITTSTSTEFTSHTSSVALAALYTLHRSDQLRLYVAPRVGIAFSNQRNSIETVVVNLPAGLPPSIINGFNRSETTEDSSSSPTAGLAFGASTPVLGRLVLFGEAGVVYSSLNAPALGPTTVIGVLGRTRTERSTISTRAIGGLMFYF
jgi:hypothetical protein